MGPDFVTDSMIVKTGQMKVKVSSYSLKGNLHKTAKIGEIFAVQLILPVPLSDFGKHPTDGHHIAQNRTER